MKRSQKLQISSDIYMFALCYNEDKNMTLMLKKPEGLLFVLFG